MKYNPKASPIFAIPYLREFVSNMTNRMPVPILCLPPVNAFAMVDDYEHRRKNTIPSVPPSAPVAPPATNAKAK